MAQSLSVKVEENYPDLSPRLDRFSRLGPFYSAKYLTNFPATLRAKPFVLTCHREGNITGFLPGLSTTAATYSFYKPRALIHELFRRFNCTAIPIAIPSQERPAITIALPSAYLSPFAAVSEDEFRLCLEFLNQYVSEHHMDAAFLYFSRNENHFRTILSDFGFVHTVLEANGLLAIDPGWRTLDDYFLGSPHGRTHRREYRRFFDKGYRVAWSLSPSSDSIERAAQLDAHHLGLKGHSLTVSERLKWYKSVIDVFEGNFALAEVVDAGNSVVATLLCLITEDTLIPKAYGATRSRSDFIYFSLVFYSTIEFALSRSLSKINFGPSAGRTKRLRGARPDELWGSFRFSTGISPDDWSRVQECLTRGVASQWTGVC
jgi:hypothetical protein